MNEKLKPYLSDIGFYITWDGLADTTTAIRKILEVLPVHDKWCVEFGAWDGVWGSNTRNLILDQDYAAVLIEGNQEKFNDLRRNYAGKSNVITVNQWVGFNGEHCLDKILKGTSIPRDFDFCCVDIDGNDYHVWQAMAKYQPKVVCIEFNPTIPPEVSFVQPADPAVNQGSSLTALIELGKQKDYELIAVIGVNAFFVYRDYYPLFQIDDNDIHALWTKRDCITYFFSGYDAKIFLRGCRKLPWHENIPLSESKMQVLPAFLRKYPYTRKRRIIYTCLTNPLEIIRKILNRIVK